MEQNEVQEPPFIQAPASHDLNTITPAQDYGAMRTPAEEAPCSSCAGGVAAKPFSFVYTLGRIEGRFPNLAAEKEFAQAAGRTVTAGKTDQQADCKFYGGNHCFCDHLCLCRCGNRKNL